jgi:hypothetical protein
VLLLGAAGFGAMMRVRWITVPAVACVVVFNLSCGWWIGELFRKDPRNEVLAFASEHIPSDAVVEVSASIPRLLDLPDKDYVVHKIPSGIDRWENFSERFASDEDVMKVVAKRKTPLGLDWFSPQERDKRNPAWIFWSSIDIEKSTKPFHDALLGPGSGYRIVWDGASPKVPPWVYPRNTEFLKNRVTILTKEANGL